MNIWQQLEQQIQAVTRQPFELIDKQKVTGGDINEAYILKGHEAAYFVKLNGAACLDMFNAEARSLAELTETGVVEVPEVLTFGSFEQYSFLLLSYMPIKPQGDQQVFAQTLAKLHLNINDQFGFEHPNYIGRTPQINGWHSDWGLFFTQKRLAYQLELLERQTGLLELVAQGRALLPVLADFLDSHNPKPALLHGDLWQGNYGFIAKHKPVLFDPACYYGDCEVDLAMLELFGHPGDEFYTCYNQINPIDSGYRQRKDIYNLYHILNHANLFGGHYVQQVQGLITGLAEQF